LRGLGALVETPGVPAYLPGSDLLAYVAQAKGVPARDRASAICRASENLVPPEVLRRPFGALSTGLARRVLLAAALVGDPQVLLLDEPTLGLDPAARHDLRLTLRSLAVGGKTLLLSTHLIEDVQEVCDRVLFLRDGLLVGDEPVDLPVQHAGGAIRLRFAKDVPTESTGRLAAPGTQVTREGPRQLLVVFTGGEDAQAEVIARAVGLGFALISATPPEPDLGRRYLSKVGREEAT